MTVDYNNTLLDYITGDITVESRSQNQFRENEEIQNNLVQEINNRAGIEADYAFKFLTSDTTSNYLVYGSYVVPGTSETDYDEFGYIAVLNQSGTVLEVITEYESGTKLGKFQALEYDSNGNIYGVDYFNDRYRVILLNNVALETTRGYVCRLRNSYYIPDTSYEPPRTTLTGTSFIRKDPANDSDYYILGQIKSGSNYNVYLIKFTINVGSANDWEYISGPTVYNSGYVFAYDFLLQQNGDTTVADIYYMGSQAMTTLEHVYYNGSTITEITDIAIHNYIEDFRILDSDTVYTASRVNNGGSYTLYLHEVNGTTLTLLDSTTLEISIPGYKLNLVNGKLFTKITGLTTDLTNYLSMCGVYYGEQYIKSPLYTTDSVMPTSTTCAVQQTYSLYKVILQGESVLYRPSIVIYDNQYSGGAYIDYNSLTPLHSEIYSNSHLVFARGLYNKQVYQNMCISTVNIPNGFLNGIPLMPSKLLGTTMLELVNNTNVITKNIYENLFLNFNNKIQVIDEDTSVLYPETANYINIGVSYGTQQQCEGSKISKMRINYTDNTNIVIPIHWVENADIKEYTYSLYISKGISSIEFINEEENFAYITKQYDFEIGKTYTITQRIRID